MKKYFPRSASLWFCLLMYLLSKAPMAGTWNTEHHVLETKFSSELGSYPKRVSQKRATAETSQKADIRRCNKPSHDHKKNIKGLIKLKRIQRPEATSLRQPNSWESPDHGLLSHETKHSCKYSLKTHWKTWKLIKNYARCFHQSIISYVI